MIKNHQKLDWIKYVKITLFSNSAVYTLIFTLIQDSEITAFEDKFSCWLLNTENVQPDIYILSTAIYRVQESRIQTGVRKVLASDNNHINYGPHILWSAAAILPRSRPTLH